MRQFRWPLQRLLAVTGQREAALKTQLLGISRQMASVRQQIFRRQAMIRTSLAQLARRSIDNRIAQQEIVMACSGIQEKHIRRHREQLVSLEAQRKAKTADFLKVRSSRETLERMREEARKLFVRQELRAEQKQFDEGAHVAFAFRAGAHAAEVSQAGG